MFISFFFQWIWNRKKKEKCKNATFSNVKDYLNKELKWWLKQPLNVKGYATIREQEKKKFHPTILIVFETEKLQYLITIFYLSLSVMPNLFCSFFKDHIMHYFNLKSQSPIKTLSRNKYFYSTSENVRCFLFQYQSKSPNFVSTLRQCHEWILSTKYGKLSTIQETISLPTFLTDQENHS